MKKNKKGFTLVELLAVIVVLIIIILLAYNIIKRNVDDTLDNTVRANAGIYIKAVNALISEKSITDSSYDSGSFTVSQLNDEGIKISGTKPDSGYVIFENSEVNVSCLKYDKYHVYYLQGEVSKPEKGECSDINKSFNYTGNEETFTVDLSGLYRLEVWGAQGGSSESYTLAIGGYGSYSTGEIYLNKGDKLYINVGGKGANGDNTSTTKNGGYNGGGNKVTPDSSYYSSSGGGATHIATTKGVLSSLSSKIPNILIVAGGGGGGAGFDGNYGYGGSAGGYTGVKGINIYGNTGWGNSGTQTAPGCQNTSSSFCGSFGQGNGTSSGHGGAGGGGFYGGGATNSGNIGGGGGGSSYIGHYNLKNKSMYCYNCTPNNIESIKTVAVTCAEEEPTEKCAKKGNGYAKITYVGSTKSDDNYKYVYSVGNEFTDVTGGWTANNFQGNGRTEKLNDSLHIYCSSTGSSGSQYSTAHSVDVDGYTKFHIVYQIVSQLTTNDWGKLRVTVGGVNYISPNLAVGIYHEVIDIPNSASTYVTIQNVDANMKILQAYFSKS